jgi:glycosyltransferase involved in cell wall biosynthesis
MTRRTRVLHVLKIFRPDFTGEGVFLERCSAMMGALDPSVEHDLLVTMTPEPVTPPPVLGLIPRRTYLSGGRLSQGRREARLLWWLMRNLHRYRVVHMRTHADWYFLSYLLIKLAGRRLVLSATLDDSVPGLVGLYGPSRRPVVRRLFRVFDAFVSISPKLHQETIAVMAPERCHLIECGIEFPPTDRARGRAMRARLGIPDDALVLIFVGGLVDRKDPMLLVRNHAAILERFPDTWLLLVGPTLEADYLAALRQQVLQSGIAHRLVFVGEVTNPHLYFEAADIMVFASKLEGFGTVVPEAMGHGLPAVVRALPGVNDTFVRPKETGFAFTDDAGYRDAVLRLAGDAALRQRIGAAGQALVRERYDMARVARRYLATYGLGPAPEPAAPPEPPVPAVLTRPIRTASITDPRFHTKVAEPPETPPCLLVLADAEEAFDWGKPFSRAATDVSSMARQDAAHRVYERYGVRPTYLVDYPVATQDAGRQPLRELLADRRCDVGAQLHPWVSPPYTEEVTTWNSFNGNLPAALEYAKLERLCGAITDAFGTAPRIYRAGRYGVGARTAEMLLALGFQADSSTMPRWSYEREGGPDYLDASTRLYWLDTARTLLEIPNSAAFVGRLAGGGDGGGRAAALFHPLSERLGLTGTAARLGLLERIKLTPEGTSTAEAKRLIRAMLATGHRTFVVSYHTSSLQPGNTPYVRNAEDLARFLGWLDEVLDFFRTEARGGFATWQDVRARALAGVASPALRDPSPALVAGG